jgi:hypothetical protein
VRHTRHQVDVVLVGEPVDVGALVPVGHRHHAPADGRVDLGDPGDLAPRAADDHRLAVRDAGGSRVGGVDHELGGLAQVAEL